MLTHANVEFGSRRDRIVDSKFVAVVEQLHPSFDKLIGMASCSNGVFPQKLPKSGVYLFSEGDRHLYVGRSNGLRRRYGEHSRPSSQHNQAVFAFKLAREMTGQQVAAYVPGPGSRVGLSQELGALADAFRAAKERVRRMEYRHVEETDQTRQAPLELYCAIVLGCPYNDFNTH